MMQPKGALGHRHVLLGLVASVIIVASLLLVTGLVVPGFMDEPSKSSALPDASASSTEGSDLPWAQLHPSPHKLTPDEAVARLATGFVDRLNGRRAADAVEMLCPGKRRVIRDAVVWTAVHRPHLRITTPFKNAARPGYVTVTFDGTIGEHQRRGIIGLDADRVGRPNCVSAFYSVG